MSVDQQKADALNKQLADAGVSKTVYAYVTPETEEGLDSLLDADRDGIHDMYRGAWTKKQDNAHREFIETWKQWSAPVMKFDHAAFPHFYPTAGASEALREAVYACLHKRNPGDDIPAIHIFNGEYEGYGAYAQAAGIRVIVHDRGNWAETLGKIGPNDRFFISQPSAIDGNVWKGFDDFVAALNVEQPKARVVLDITYVGAVARPFTVEAFSPNVRDIVFSLSKPMGVYYHRIGGMLSRDEYPGLWGNMWFKNLLSLRLGTELMKRHGVFDLPKKYKPVQDWAAQLAGAKLGLELAPSDVFLLATAKPSENPGDIEKFLARAGTARVCLTPTIAEVMNPAQKPAPAAAPKGPRA